MSTWHDEQITCPHCSATQTVKAATGIHASRIPHVRDRVLRGEFHRFACTTCTRPIEVRQRLIYTDFERGHWIEVRLPDDIPLWRELAKECFALYTRAIERGAPVLRERVASFRVRLVFGYDELREKLALWDAGLDDADVEMLKLLAVREDPSIFGVTDRLLVRAVADGELVIDRIRSGSVVGTLTFPIRTTKPSALRDELIGTFVSINRLIGRYAVTAS